MYLREEESTTGIGEEIAIPHGKCDAVNEPVTFLFLIATPNTEDNIHLDVLSKLSVMLMDDNFTESLRNAGSVDEFIQCVVKPLVSAMGI